MLAQSTDRVWYPAVIVDVFPDNTVKVMFERNDEVMTLKIEDVLPMGKYYNAWYMETRAHILDTSYTVEPRLSGLLLSESPD